MLAAVFFYSLSQVGELDASSLGYLIIGCLILLAILEHCFLMLPIKDAALWNWAIGASKNISSAQKGSKSIDEVGGT